ncbi:unnamed protein product, partial [Mesorhabditis spiculigera]
MSSVNENLAASGGGRVRGPEDLTAIFWAPGFTTMNFETVLIRPGSTMSEKSRRGPKFAMKLFRKVDGFRHNDEQYLCCFHELHCKSGCFVVNVLNSFLFCILAVQTIFSSEKQHLDFYALLIQGTVIACTFYALPRDKPLLLIPAIIFWIVISILFSILIALSLAYGLHPTSFPEQAKLHATEKLGMVRGVAFVGMFMLTVLAAVCVWFIIIHIRTYKYVKKIRE